MEIVADGYLGQRRTGNSKVAHSRGPSLPEFGTLGRWRWRGDRRWRWLDLADDIKTIRDQTVDVFELEVRFVRLAINVKVAE